MADDDDDRPSNAEILIGWDVDALTAAIEKAEDDGEEVDLEVLAQLLGVSQAWVEQEYGDDHELEIELDDDLAAKLASDLGLDRINSVGSGERN
jgi:hypothetical protein